MNPLESYTLTLFYFDGGQIVHKGAFFTHEGAKEWADSIFDNLPVSEHANVSKAKLEKITTKKSRKFSITY